MKTLTLSFFFFSTFLFANTEPIKVASTIQKVTVFKSGAQVSRVAKTVIPKGKNVLKLYNLPPSFEEKSLQLKAEGDFTILAVQHQLHIDTVTVNHLLINRLLQSNDSLVAIIEEWDLELKVLAEEEALILNNDKNKSGDTHRLPIEELKSMAAFYRSQLKEIRLEKLYLKRKIAKVNQQITKQKQAITAQRNKATIIQHKEVWVTTLASIVTNGKFELSYFVNNAGWIPTYDLRVKDVLYKAHVFQNSGEDWETVKLTLSNANPRQSGQKPILNKWNLGFYNPSYRPITRRSSQTGITYNADGSKTIKGRIFDEAEQESLIGASIIVSGTNIGATTDIDGNFVLRIPAGYSALEISYAGFASKKINLANTYNYEFGLSGGVLLDEVVVTGYAGRNKRISRPRKQKKEETKPVVVTTFQKTTSVEFQIKEAYTIKKDGEKYMVTIQQLEIPAYYEYYCAPKIEAAVFLTAMISDWETYNLLSGATNLYFEGTFLGNAYLDVENLQDTISLSLGRDKNILVKRNLQKDYSKKQLIGAKKVETKAIQIDIRNKKKQAINLVLEDQMPVTVDSEIEVKIGNYKGATMEEDSKILKWKLNILPETTQQMNFNYSVKYPKKKQVILD